MFDRELETQYGRFRLVAYRDSITQLPHFAFVRGVLDGPAPVPTRVQVRDTLADVLHLPQADGALSLAAALEAIARHERGVVVVLSDADETAAVFDRLERLDEPRADDAAREWRRHGLGAQILADLGARRLQVLGKPRRYLGLSGFGIEIAGYEDAGQRREAET